MTKLLKTLAPWNSRVAAWQSVPRNVRACWSIYLTWRMRRAASRSLSKLNDFQLKDIGLHRSEIDSAIRDGTSRWRYRRP